MSLPTYYTETLRLIQTLLGLGPSGCGNACGYTVAEITVAHNSFFPTTLLTEDQVNTYMRYGVKKGVFLFGGCRTSASPPIQCADLESYIPTHPTSSQTFFVNTAMAALNPINAAYLNPVPSTCTDVCNSQYPGFRATGQGFGMANTGNGFPGVVYCTTTCNASTSLI